MAENRVWIPNFIRKVFDFKSNKKISAKELNAILNLLVTQGDYNSEWLEYLHKHGIPDAIAGISQGTLTEVLTEAVKQEIDYLTATVSNKTSRKLNNPLFTFVDLGSSKETITVFKNLLEEKEVVGCLTAYPELVGNSAAYPTEQQLIDAKNAGHLIMCSTSASSVTGDTVESIVSNASTWLSNTINTELLSSDLDKNIFVYPAATNVNIHIGTVVSKYFAGAINVNGVQRSADSDTVEYTDIPAVFITATNNLDSVEVRRIIENTITNSAWCVFVVDTASDSFSLNALSQLIEHIKEQPAAEIVTADVAVMRIKDTINRILKELTNLPQEVAAVETRLVDKMDAMYKAITALTKEFNEFKSGFYYNAATRTLSINLNGGG